VGQKRNRGVSLATKEFVFMMDDDDYYRPGYLKYHLALFGVSNLPCHVCSTIGVFHLTKMYSMINTPPLNIAPEQRASEATLAFRRSFWEGKQFPEVEIAEGEGFLAGRMEQVMDISWEGIYVSFLHDGSTSSRDTYEGEPNGCHYEFSDRFFQFVTNLASLHSGKKSKLKNPEQIEGQIPEQPNE
jgi:glycosyltransferase involved in cell wall biosynthesis